MVVTRQSTYHDAGETAEDGHLEAAPAPDINRVSIDFQPPLTFVFRPPSQNYSNAAEEFDVAEDADSVTCDSEPPETASDAADSARPAEVSPQRGGGEVVRLLASLHDLSRQMEATMADLRAQLGRQLGHQTWPAGGFDSRDVTAGDYDSRDVTAGDYDPRDVTAVHQADSTPRIKRIQTAVSVTWRGVVSSLILLWNMTCLRFPAATARLAELGRRLRPLLPALGFLLLARIACGVYTTHQRLVEQRRRAAPWL